MKEVGTTHWSSPNTGATNEIGFSALPGGKRDSNGLFCGIGSYSFWWSSAEGFNDGAWARSIYYDLSGIYDSY